MKCHPVFQWMLGCLLVLSACLDTLLVAQDEEQMDRAICSCDRDGKHEKQLVEPGRNLLRSLGQESPCRSLSQVRWSWSLISW